MNVKRTLFGTILAVAASAMLPAAVPEVTGVTMTQANDRLVTITYTLSDASAVVTVDVQTNAVANAASDDPGWTSIGGEAVWNALGDVWRRVDPGSRTITWHPDHSWPDHKIDGNSARAVVTAWALENTPDYMVVDLTGVPAADVVRYYPAVDFLPKKTFDQAGAAVTNNPDYKTTKLLMRKIMARGVEWTMGSTTLETERNADREATHLVTLTNNYYIGVFQITQRQWALIATNSNASAYFQVDGAMRPMERICHNEMRFGANKHADNPPTSAEIAAYSWPNAPAPDSFLGLLRSRTGLDFDLPSDAQWEFAARAGHGSPYYGDGSEIDSAHVNVKLLGRYRYNGGLLNNGTIEPDQYLGPTNGTAIVGSYKPNDWGLYDTYGNVWEFCLDWLENDIGSYGGQVNIALDNPAYPLSKSAAGSNRIYRGGDWMFEAKYCRSAQRGLNNPGARDKNYGVRVVCTAGLR